MKQMDNWTYSEKERHNRARLMETYRFGCVGPVNQSFDSCIWIMLGVSVFLMVILLFYNL